MMIPVEFNYTVVGVTRWGDETIGVTAIDTPEPAGTWEETSCVAAVVSARLLATSLETLSVPPRPLRPTDRKTDAGGRDVDADVGS